MRLRRHLGRGGLSFTTLGSCFWALLESAVRALTLRILNWLRLDAAPLDNSEAAPRGDSIGTLALGFLIQCALGPRASTLWVYVLTLRILNWLGLAYCGPPNL